MIFNTNPYIVEDPVGGTGAFVGRRDVLRNALHVLSDPHKNGAVFYGQRRIGKTSVMKELMARLPRREGYSPIYFNFRENAASSPEQILQAISYWILYSVDIPFFGGFNEDFITGFQNDFLPSVLSRLPEKSALIFLFDELDTLDAPGSEQIRAVIFPCLRKMMSDNGGRVKFIFAIGQWPEDLSGECLSLLSSLKFQRISLLSREDTGILVNLSRQNASLKWSEDMIEHVWNLTGGHPYLTQHLCHVIWECLYDREPTDVPSVLFGDIAAAAPETLKIAAVSLRRLWDSLRPVDRVIASVLADTGAEGLTREALENCLQDTRMLIGNLKHAPRVLEEWGLILSENGKYRIRVELLRQWIVQRNQALASVQDKIDRNLAKADSLFKQARDFFREKNAQEAARLLEQAIRLDPNHQKAKQLLIEILLERGDREEALTLLEELYEYNPWAARPRLIQTLLDQGRKARQESERLNFYKKILVLEPRHPEALAEYGKCYERQGDAAYENHDLNQALEAYQKADSQEKIGMVSQRLRTEDIYQQAIAALGNGEGEKAQKMLAEVLSADPSFREATRYMHLAVTGRDISEPDSLIIRFGKKVKAGIKGLMGGLRKQGKSGKS